MNEKKKIERNLYPTTYRGNRTAQSKRYRNKNKLKYIAHWKINNEIRYGRIIRPILCSMCGKKGLIVSHHHDYKKPLDVIWVCYVCHNKIHEEGK